MSSEKFELLDNEPFDKSIIKINNLKIYHHQEGNLDDPNQHIEFIFGADNIYQQFGNAFLQFHITKHKDDITKCNDEAISW